MKGFIFTTFAFLGWAFYVASGGADYEPHPGSLQARVAEEPEVAPETEPTELVAVDNTSTSLDDLDLSKSNELQVTLASVTQDDQSVDSIDQISDTGTDLDKVADLTAAIAEELERPPVIDSIVTPQRDIREVTGNIVNMRDGPGTSFDRVGQLTKGTQIQVLEDPGKSWIKLKVVESGEEGWIATWLLTASN